MAIEPILNGIAAFTGIAGMTIKDLFEKDTKNERGALEQYIIPMKKHFDYWEYILKEARISLTKHDYVNEFIGVYVSNDRFTELRYHSYLLPLDLEDAMKEFFKLLDEYIYMSTSMLNGDEDDLMLYAAIKHIDNTLKDAINNLGR